MDSLNTATKTRYGIGVYVGLAALVAATIGLYALWPMPGQNVAGIGDTVTLHPAQVNTIVQMFDTLEGEPNVVTFPAGTACQKLSNSIAYHDGGPPLYFYKLDCGGTIGYVNVMWVR